MNWSPLTAPSYVFLYMSKYKDVDRKLKFVSQFKFFKSKLPTIFIATFHLQKMDTPKELMKTIWRKYSLLYFGILFSSPKSILMTYHPFRDEILNTSNILEAGNSLANYHFTDMNGVSLKAVIFNSLPHRLWMKLGLVNEDWELWTNLVKNLNMSFEKTFIRQGFRRGMQMLKIGEVDFCPYLYFLNELNSNLDYIAPYGVEYLVALVPQSKKIHQSFYMFLTLSPTFWALVCGSLISLIITAIIGRRNKRGNQYIIFAFVKTLCNQSVSNISSLHSYHILLINLWQYASLLILAAYQVSLLKSLLIAKYDQQINTIQALKSSNLPIYIPIDMKTKVEISVPLLKTQLIPLSYDDIDDIIFEFDNKRRALILMHSTAKLVIEAYSRHSIDSSYHIMDEVITPGFSTYFFTKNSPYVNIFDKMLLKQYQHGLESRYTFSRRTSSYNENTKLTLNHLQGVFFVLLFGLFLSTFIFTLERFQMRYFCSKGD
ncbi:hypothetical protein WA026_018526 [Henosepilachna vigintioctopunctata]|uniref:Ionotropic receptor n=1 Tax=Henosepilachna vigintioctopunctata TaxID=420089 RepID=A0AAW1U9X6_9CUCU